MKFVEFARKKNLHENKYAANIQCISFKAVELNFISLAFCFSVIRTLSVGRGLVGLV